MATKALNQSDLPSRHNEGHPRRWWILGVVSFASFILFADNTIVNTALPSIARDLDASTSQLQWIVDSYVLMLAGLLLVGGTIGDLFGRRRWLAIGLGVFVTGATVAAVSTDTNQLILGRAIQGLGGALIMPTTLSILTNVFPSHERAKAIGIWTGVTGLAMGFGPALGGFIVDVTEWHMVFWLHLPAVALAFAGLTIVPESRDSRTRSLDIPGAVFGTTALTSLVFAIIQGGEAGWTSTVVLGSTLVAALAFTTFVFVESRASNPMLPMHFFKKGDFTAAVVIIGLVFFSVSVTFFFLTQFYQFVQGRSAFEAGALGIPCALAMGVGAPISGVLVKRFGAKVLVVSAMAFLGLGLMLLSRVNADTSTLQICATIFLFGLAGGLGLVPLTDIVMSSVPVEEAGVASAVNDVSRELGSALGIAVIGSVVNGMYRSNISNDPTSGLPPELVHTASEGIGIAGGIAGTLPADVAARLLNIVNGSFVDAIGAGFVISAAILVLPMIAAAFFLPGRAETPAAKSNSIPEEDFLGVKEVGLAA
ncbi:MAG: MFS transporter [bacterium]